MHRLKKYFTGKKNVEQVSPKQNESSHENDQLLTSQAYYDQLSQSIEKNIEKISEKGEQLWVVIFIHLFICF